ncbi:hypothetical protein F5Y18DRAFT_423466 [Xylariaceae sp. FL1019]|nr:hypothetical protein F5Y18DRAFT_423466 [Xylariaceae sp. FL1019]
MSTFIASRRADLPSSPWATRFPYQDFTYVEDSVNHSSLAPLYPRIGDPKFYDVAPSDAQAPTTSKETDRLFWHESLQSRELLGLRTWEVAALRRWLHFSTKFGFISGGHQPPSNPDVEAAALSAYDRDRIRVDETQWAPFLRKERWFDWNEDDKIYGNWSVDDPNLWSSITTSIELANRMLSELLRERNEGGRYLAEPVFVTSMSHSSFDNMRVCAMELLLTGWIRTTNYHLGSNRELGYCKKQRIAREQGNGITPWDWATTKSPDDSRDRLIKLLKNVVWGFLPTLNSRGALGVTHSTDTTFNDYTFISISTEIAERLKDADLTLAERCETQVMFSILLIHELMHAILLSRESDGDRDYIGNRWDRNAPLLYEPYLNAAGINEAGAFMEQKLFGGLFRTYPFLSSQYWRDGRRPFPIMLASAMKEFPDGETRGEAVSASSFNKAGALTTVYHMPLLWHSRLLSEEFWGQQNPKSTNFFHRSAYLFAQSPSSADNEGPRSWQQPQVQMSPLESRSTGDQRFKDEFDERRLIWKLSRMGWFAEAQDLWDRSPWQNQDARERYERFSGAFADRDEILCANIATSLALSVRWDRDDASYQADLPLADPDVGGNWAWHILGLLMMASMPIRKQARSDQRSKSEWRTLEPTNTATSAGYTEDVIFIDKPRPIVSVAPASVLYHTDANNAWKSMASRHITQQRYLDAAHALLRNIGLNEVAVHSDFYDALIKLYHNVSKAREDLEHLDPSRCINEWSPEWNFTLPTYNPGSKPLTPIRRHGF